MSRNFPRVASRVSNRRNRNASLELRARAIPSAVGENSRADDATGWKTVQQAIASVRVVPKKAPHRVVQKRVARQHPLRWTPPAGWSDITKTAVGEGTKWTYVDPKQNGMIWLVVIDAQVENVKEYAKSLEKVFIKQYSFITKHDDSGTGKVAGIKCRLQKCQGTSQGAEMTTLILVLPYKGKVSTSPMASTRNP